MEELNLVGRLERKKIREQQKTKEVLCLGVNEKPWKIGEIGKRGLIRKECWET